MNINVRITLILVYYIIWIRAVYGRESRLPYVYPTNPPTPRNISAPLAREHGRLFGSNTRPAFESQKKVTENARVLNENRHRRATTVGGNRGRRKQNRNAPDRITTLRLRLCTAADNDYLPGRPCKTPSPRGRNTKRRLRARTVSRRPRRLATRRNDGVRVERSSVDRLHRPHFLPTHDRYDFIVVKTRYTHGSQ